MQLLDPPTRSLFERGLEAVRRKYCLRVIGYVVMPEHVHLLVGEPERETLAVAMPAMKQSVSRRRVGVGGHFRQRRYYDFNVWTEKKRIEKLRYIHRNPVKRGLVERPEDWESTPPRARAARGGDPVRSSYRHYLAGQPGVVEIESHWTARARERLGWRPQVRIKKTTPP
jgi:putative transposase